MGNTLPTGLLAAVGLLSASALAYEILLTRIFAIVHWHHLVAIAISLALLGYGASGTFLTLMGPRLTRHYAAAFIGNALLFAAIPAVVAYNRFAHDADRIAVRFESFMEEFSNILQRQIR